MTTIRIRATMIQMAINEKIEPPIGEQAIGLAILDWVKTNLVHIPDIKARDAMFLTNTSNIIEKNYVDLSFRFKDK